MPDEGIRGSAAFLDLSSRVQASTTVVGSPALAAETIIASLTIPLDLAIVTGILVMGWAAYTLGTSAASCQLRLRRTNVAGTVVGNTGAQTGGHSTAGQLVSDDVNGFDTGATLPNQVYVMTLQVASGAAASTVSSVFLAAMVV
jgi:hypothetical protein